MLLINLSIRSLDPKVQNNLEQQSMKEKAEFDSIKLKNEEGEKN